MKKILVSGLLNIESSISVDSFPIMYSPIEYRFNGIHSLVSGVGFNVSKALKILGDDVDVVSIIGNGLRSELIMNQLKKDGINGSLVVRTPETKTPESVVIFDRYGTRKIYCDLKNLQEGYSIDPKTINFEDYSLLVITNINFNRELLKESYKHDVMVATDVHIIDNIHDEYNTDFMKRADILFLSNERIVEDEKTFLKNIYQEYHNKIIVLGKGKEGALCYVGAKDQYYSEPSCAPNGITSTVGAGDALFSAFIHYYLKGKDYQSCLKHAVTFAGLKIASSGGSKGFVSEEELEKYMN